MSTPELVPLYKDNSNLIQNEDLTDLHTSAVSDKIRQRAMTVFLESIKGDNFEEEFMTSLGGNYGLENVGGEWKVKSSMYSLSNVIVDALKCCLGAR